MKLRLYIIKKPPNNPEYYYVASVDEAVKKVDEILSGTSDDIPIVFGLEEYDEELGWVEYYDEYMRDLPEIYAYYKWKKEHNL